MVGIAYSAWLVKRFTFFTFFILFFFFLHLLPLYRGFTIAPPEAG